MKNDAIIGHTGFVGGAVALEHAFNARFNRANIDTIAGTVFDTVVCAAAPGSMFIANRSPDHDRAAIDALIDKLKRVRAKRFVLISSIAVLADFAAGVDEHTQSFEQDLAYGRHRRVLEAFCESHFDKCLVVRLPALFGPQLKKNLIFDLMNPVPSMLTEARLEALLDHLVPPLRDALAVLYTLDSKTELFHLNRAILNANSQRLALDTAVRGSGLSAMQFHNPCSRFQFYDVMRLWHDIETAIKADLHTLHLAVEPLRASDIYTRLFGAEMPDTGARLHQEDMHTCFAAKWHRDGAYLEDAARVMDKLASFYTDQRNAP